MIDDGGRTCEPAAGGDGLACRGQLKLAAGSALSRGRAVRRGSERLRGNVHTVELRLKIKRSRLSSLNRQAIVNNVTARTVVRSNQP
jgi:hypothetical protein